MTEKEIEEIYVKGLRKAEESGHAAAIELVESLLQKSMLRYPRYQRLKQYRRAKNCLQALALCGTFTEDPPPQDAA